MTRWLVVLALLTAGCSRASDEAGAKQWASEPPPEDVAPPKDLQIGVTVDGAAQASITATLLLTTPPDFEDPERRAWLISTLVPAATPGSRVQAFSPQGVGVTFERPSPTGFEPVLFLTRRGDLIVSAVDPKDPFPRYHGQGGRLRRVGDSLPRVMPVTRLEIVRR